MLDKSPTSDLNSDETLLQTNPATGNCNFFGGQGGYLYTTNKRIFFEKGISKPRQNTINIEFKNIKQVLSVRYSCVVMALPLMKCLDIVQNDGSITKIMPGGVFTTDKTALFINDQLVKHNGVEGNQKGLSDVKEEDDLSIKLEKLKELKDKGILDNEEFDKKKKDLLDKF
jgi:hypothetical protein